MKGRLEKIPLGNDRINFLKSDEFKKNILKSYWGNFTKGLLILPCECSDAIEVILPSCHSGFEKDILLCVNVSPSNKKDINAFIKNGFSNPFMKDDKLWLSRTNVIQDFSVTDAKNEVEHVSTATNGSSACQLTATFSKDALTFLKNSTKDGFTINKNGKETQKELSGELYVKGTTRIKGGIVYVIDVMKDSVRSGEEESVDVMPTRYNFHSHPMEAYVNNSVEKAWPSLTDYLGIIHLGKNTIFHCVATLEGLYVVSFGQYWGSRIEEIDKTFVKNNFKINQRTPWTPLEYTQKMNGILHKGNPIFEVKFFEWGKVKPFKVHFSESGKGSKTCITSEKTMKRMKSIVEK